MRFGEKSVLCVGELLWDRLPSGPVPGGAPMNVALHLTQLGHEVLFASTIGADEAGQQLEQFLLESGIKTELIQRNSTLPTSEVIVSLDKNKDPIFSIAEPVAWDQIELKPELKRSAKEAGVIIYGTLAARNSQTRDTILSLLHYDNIKLLDINLRQPYDKMEVVEQLLAHADIVKMNDSELIKISRWYGLTDSELKKIMKWFCVKFNKRFLCVTLGKDGAIVLEDGKIIENSGYKVTTVDTVGSGDAFLAGFISKKMNGESTEKALSYACALGAYVATKPGATPQHIQEEIQVILNQKT